MEHEICIQCGAEVRPEEAYHVAEEAVCPSCAEADTVECSYCGERIWRENDFGDSDMALCMACRLPLRIIRPHLVLRRVRGQDSNIWHAFLTLSTLSASSKIRLLFR